MLAQHKVLFEQTSVRGMELKNRFAMAPMGPWDWETPTAGLTSGASTTTPSGPRAAPG